MSTSSFQPLSYRFDVDRLRDAVEAVPADAWRRDPARPGVRFVALVHRRGDHTDDRVRGPFRPTTWLDTDSYLARVIASLGVPVGLTRLVRVPAGGPAVPVDLRQYWLDRSIVHIPVVTAPELVMSCADEHRHLPAGTAWLLDPLRSYRLDGPDGAECIRLEIATTGGPTLLADTAGHDGPVDPAAGSGPLPAVRFDRSRPRAVEPAGVVAARIDRLTTLLPAGQERLLDGIRTFGERWRAAWIVHRNDAEADRYRQERERLAALLAELDGVDEPLATSGVSAVDLVRVVLLGTAVRPDGGLIEDDAADPGSGARFDRPVFVVASPRAGARRLFDALSGGADVVTTEHGLQRYVNAALDGRRPTPDSDVRTADDLTDRLATQLVDALSDALIDRDGVPPPMRATGLRMLDASHQNALRIGLLDRLFPDARFILLTRDPTDEIAEMVMSWEAGDLVSRPDLPGWDGPPWSMLLVPGWQELAGLPVEQICARQWETTTTTILDDLDRIAPGRWTAVDHDALVAAPRRELRRLLRFAGLDDTVDQARTMPLTRHQLVRPDPAIRSSEGLTAAVASVAATAERVRRVADVRPDRRPRRADPRPSAPRGGAFAELLGSIDAALLVSVRRPDEVLVVQSLGGRLAVEPVAVPGPAGISCSRRGELVVATSGDLWTFRNQPDAARRLDPNGSYGACFVLRHRHHTGDIDAHEVVRSDDGEIWLVATRYSCLATVDPDYSFVPRWAPSFVSGLSGDDRCHLTGVGLRDGRPRYVTAYSETDVGHAWKDTATFGGIVVDVESDEIVARGLSMPNSPRWYRDRLWVLQSGSGAFGRVDLDTGRFEEVCSLPGTLQGLAFVGRYAILGVNSIGRRARSELVLVDLDEGTVVGRRPLDHPGSEIRDVQLRPGPGRLFVAGLDTEYHAHAVVVPTDLRSGDTPAGSWDGGR